MRRFLISLLTGLGVLICCIAIGTMFGEAIGVAHHKTDYWLSGLLAGGALGVLVGFICGFISWDSRRSHDH